MDGIDGAVCLVEGCAERLGVVPCASQGLAVAAQDVGEVFAVVVSEAVRLKFAQEEAVDLVEELIETVGGRAEVAEDGVRGGGEGEAWWASRGVVELADAALSPAASVDLIKAIARRHQTG